MTWPASRCARSAPRESEPAIAPLEPRRFSEQATTIAYPCGDPIEQSVERKQGIVEELVHARCIAQQRVRCFIACELRRNAKSIAQCTREVDHAQRVGTRDVHDVRFRC